MSVNQGLYGKSLIFLLAVWALPQIASATSTTDQTTNTSTTTTTVPEFSFYVGDWAVCSVTCEIGSRQREVFCYRTCSNPRACTSGVTEWDCFNLGQTKPSETDLCFGAEPVCPATSTATASKTQTRTITTSTATEVTQTTTRGVVDGWECVPGGNNCVVEQIAATQCGTLCSCCQRSTTQAPFIPSRTTTPRPVVEDSSGVLVAVLVGLVVTAACVVVVFAVIGWRYYANKPKIRQKPRSHGPHGPHTVQAEAFGASADQDRRVHPDEPSEKTVFDRKLGRGVPSAAPDGYYDGPPDWMNDEEAGTSSKTTSPRGAFSRAHSHSAFETGKQESAKSASPSRRRRQETQDPETQESRKPPEPERPSPNAPSGTLPPGYAAAARKNRRTGKDPPDVGGSDDAEAREAETNMPGQANAESPKSKGAPKSEGPKSSSASAPNQESKAGQAPKGGGSDQKHEKDSPRDAGNASRSKTGTGARESSKANPRVAADTAAVPEASDLIAKVDHELDQSQCKDLETRRRVFKNLILKWHPDKNQEEVLAAEVFRHLMGRRGRFLEA
eukprot:symbB.v1.2.010390.t1/scaffold638.1/size177989/9